MTVLICSVGGSPEPIIKSIDTQQPEKVIYVVSQDSRTTIKTEIENKLTWRGVNDTQKITLTNFQDLLACVTDIRNGIEQAFTEMALPRDTVLVADITGGTKVMSAALTLAMMEYPSKFTYIGGNSRTKNGLGTVEDGHEIFMKLDNPWEVMALREVRDFTQKFNNGLFDAALQTVKDLVPKMGEKSKFYQSIADMIDGYRLWENFDHKAALNKLRQSKGRLEPYTLNSEKLSAFLRDLQENVDFLERVQNDALLLRGGGSSLPSGCGHAYLPDLIANARRRAGTGHFDDAVARLYSAIEKCAKIALMADCGINNSAVDLSLVPEAARAELRECTDAEGVIRIGLQRSFRLLQALGHPLGGAYDKQAEKLEKSLEVRNLSLLAHGYNPVSAELYQTFFAMVLTFVGVEENELPEFLKLDWKTLLI